MGEPHIQRAVERMRGWSREKLLAEKGRCGPGQTQTIAADRILDRMERSGDAAAEQREEGRHKESIDVARSANTLAKWAIVIAIAAMAVSVVQTFWR